MCFVKMDIQEVITTFVETMLPRFSDEKTVFVMSFGLQVRKKDDYDSSPISRKVHLMFHRPHNYTKVLWNVSEGWDTYRNYNEWQLKCDHDSCWRGDGIGTPFFDLAQEMMKEIRPEVNGCPDVEVSISFSLSANPELVKLESYSLNSDERTFTVEYAPLS
jgi:hypothetical protein